MDAKTMTMNSLTTQDKAKSLLGRVSRDNLVLFGLLASLSTMMVLFILMPLWAMLTKSVQNANGEFVGLANFATYFFLFKLVGVGGKHLHFGRDCDLCSGCACVLVMLRADSFMHAV